MEQKHRSAIAVLADAGHPPAKIVKMTKLPKSTVYRVYTAYKKLGSVVRKEHTTRSDSK